MYQSISQRFRRKNSNDLIVTFLPVVVVLTPVSYTHLTLPTTERV